MGPIITRSPNIVTLKGASGLNASVTLHLKEKILALLLKKKKIFFFKVTEYIENIHNVYVH